MRDPYSILGLSRRATAEEVKRSYRRLAKQFHPDLNPGDWQVEQRFKEAAAAYELLSDPAKRARFDRGEIDASGAERGFRYTRRDGGFRKSATSAEDDLFVDDILADLLRAKSNGTGSAPQRGEDAELVLRIGFAESALGTRRRVPLGGGRTVEVVVPAGVESGQKLRLKGQGGPGRGGGAAGDALVEIVIEPHDVFRRQGRDILSDLAISLPEAVLGARVTVPTLHGPVALKIPPGSNGGTRLRLKGKGLPEQPGVPPGDQYVTLRLVLPDPPEPELARFLDNWAPRHPYAVRGALAESGE